MVVGRWLGCWRYVIIIVQIARTDKISPIPIELKRTVKQLLVLLHLLSLLPPPLLLDAS
jgi:hypothetical protein